MSDSFVLLGHERWPALSGALWVTFSPVVPVWAGGGVLATQAVLAIAGDQQVQVRARIVEHGSTPL